LRKHDLINRHNIMTYSLLFICEIVQLLYLVVLSYVYFSLLFIICDIRYFYMAKQRWS